MEDSRTPKPVPALFSRYRFRIVSAGALLLFAGVWILTATWGIADVIAHNQRISDEIEAHLDEGPIDRIDFDPDIKPTRRELKVPWTFLGNSTSPFPLIIVYDVAYQFGPEKGERSRNVVLWLFGYKVVLQTFMVRNTPATESLDGSTGLGGDALPTAIPIYITPFYSSEGPQVNVGPYSHELAGATAETIRELAKKMKADRATLPIETMYVMSIRLYDLGHKQEAVYWFYSAYYRDRLLRALLSKESIGGIGDEAFERGQAGNSFHRLAGEYINGYAFGDLPSLQESLRRVMTENETPPDLKAIYPNLEFIDRESWPEQNSEVAAGLHQLLNYIANNPKEIHEMRKKNGIEGKY